MNTTIGTNTDETNTATTARAATKRKRPAAARISTTPVIDDADLLVKRPASEVSRLVFMVLLGCAACIALIGVVSQATATGTSPDDPAPDVIIELAD